MILKIKSSIIKFINFNPQPFKKPSPLMIGIRTKYTHRIFLDTDIKTINHISRFDIIPCLLLTILILDIFVWSHLHLLYLIFHRVIFNFEQFEEIRVWTFNSSDSASLEIVLWNWDIAFEAVWVDALDGDNSSFDLVNKHPNYLTVFIFL